MNNIKAKISFYSLPSDPQYNKRVFKTGMIVDFKVREDMFNAGKIYFLDRSEAKPGDSDIPVEIQFLHLKYLKDYIYDGESFTFGQVSIPYGKGIFIDL
jgi:hypothetical protein